MKEPELLIEHFGRERTRLITDYLSNNDCELIFKAPRKTKLGDFSVRAGKKRISVNRDLNPFRFILTTIHELAHLMTYQSHGWRVKPHGPEWKNNFRNLMELWRIEDLFSKSEPLHSLFIQEFRSPSACAGIQVEKERVLSSFDQGISGVMLVELADNQQFDFKGQRYIKGQLRRTRVLCTRIANGKKYTIHKASWVKPVS